MTVEDIILSPEAISKVLSMVRKEEYLKNHRYDYFYDRYRRFFWILDKVREK